jgi:geranylgeranyl diphosphate synthase type I
MVDFKTALADDVSKIDGAIIQFFDGRDITAKNDEFVLYYYDTIRQYIMAGGKRMRPFLLAETYRGLAQEPADDQIWRPSICVEFLHNASLIHDDIIDRDDTRRGNPAFHALFKQYYIDKGFAFATPAHYGTTIGILGGDSTFFLGLEALQCDFPAAIVEQAIALYCKAYHQICEGVLMEMNFVQIPEVNEAQYLQMVSLKTGSLIEKAMLIGATLAQSGDAEKAAVSKYAIALGMAFQIKDDILGSFGDAVKTGKPTDGDIKEGKKTLLLLKAIQQVGDDERLFIENIAGQEGIGGEDVDRVRDIFTSSGAVQYCMEKIGAYSEEAGAAIDSLEGDMKDDQRELLKAMVQYNQDRDK